MITASEESEWSSYDFLFGRVIHGSQWDTLGSTHRSHIAHKYDWSNGVALAESDPSSHSHRIMVRCLVCSLYDDLIGFQSETTVNPFDYHRSFRTILDPVQADLTGFNIRLKQICVIIWSRSSLLHKYKWYDLMRRANWNK